MLFPHLTLEYQSPSSQVASVYHPLARRTILGSAEGYVCTFLTFAAKQDDMRLQVQRTL